MAKPKEEAEAKAKAEACGMRAATGAELLPVAARRAVVGPENKNKSRAGKRENFPVGHGNCA